MKVCSKTREQQMICRKWRTWMWIYVTEEWEVWFCLSAFSVSNLGHSQKINQPVQVLDLNCKYEFFCASWSILWCYRHLEWSLGVLVLPSCVISNIENISYFTLLLNSTCLIVAVLHDFTKMLADLSPFAAKHILHYFWEYWMHFPWLAFDEVVLHLLNLKRKTFWLLKPPLPFPKKCIQSQTRIQPSHMCSIWDGW